MWFSKQALLIRWHHYGDLWHEGLIKLVSWIIFTSPMVSDQVGVFLDSFMHAIKYIDGETPNGWPMGFFMFVLILGILSSDYRSLETKLKGKPQPRDP